MNVLILLVFLSAMMVVLALGLYAWTLRERTHEHTDRMSLLPLEDDAPPPPNGGTEPE